MIVCFFLHKGKAVMNIIGHIGIDVLHESLSSSDHQLNAMLLLKGDVKSVHVISYDVPTSPSIRNSYTFLTSKYVTLSPCPFSH